MRHDIFLLGIPQFAQGFIEDVVKQTPRVIVESNFEQVYAMVKLHEVRRICILFDVFNINIPHNYARGQRAAEMIHLVDPTIPILVWDGRLLVPPLEDAHLPEVLQLTGEPVPIKYNNELYLESIDYQPPRKQGKIVQKFFAGTLKENDVPAKKSLEFTF